MDTGTRNGVSGSRSSFLDPTVLRIFDQDKLVIIAIDASGAGLGAVLSQPNATTVKLHPILYGGIPTKISPGVQQHEPHICFVYFTQVDVTGRQG